MALCLSFSHTTSTRAYHPPHTFRLVYMSFIRLRTFAGALRSRALFYLKYPHKSSFSLFFRRWFFFFFTHVFIRCLGQPFPHSLFLLPGSFSPPPQSRPIGRSWSMFPLFHLLQRCVLSSLHQISTFSLFSSLFLLSSPVVSFPRLPPNVPPSSRNHPFSPDVSSIL